jgi:hypothetical protein
VLFQTMHDIIGNAVTFFFRQFLAESSNQCAPLSANAMAKLSMPMSFAPGWGHRTSRCKPIETRKALPTRLKTTTARSIRLRYTG